MRYAVIDIGTNSCRLLIAEIKAEQISPVYRSLITTRLGQGFKKNPIISGAAINRTCQALNSFMRKMQEYNVLKYRVIATSAVREATNKEEFLAIVRDECLLNVHVIDGATEAKLNYRGVINSLSIDKAPLVVDLGGGSTEFIYSDKLSLSIPLGAVKVLEFNMSVDEIKEAFQMLNSIQVEINEIPVVFVGGTATSLVAIKYGLENYDSSFIHGQLLSYQEVSDLYGILSQTPLHLRKKIAGLQADRADIIVGGTLTLMTIMEILAIDEIIISVSDLLEGVISTLAN
ncbi:MAG TPA: Ppx/GppA phosphatase family protein [Syntrophomonadaceae bacterium]|nr:Ppx/GppA phosphatase family protein [Syntrophomonadaceae bacterium]